MGKTGTLELPRAARRSLWLAAGVAFGLALGFLAGLTRPRVKA